VELLHELLVEPGGGCAPSIPGGLVHLAAGQEEPDEDWATIAYLADTATEAGLRPTLIAMEDIGWDRGKHLFVDEAEQEISTCFKLYPWDWMLSEPFGRKLLTPDPANTTRWIEPVWKLLLGSKALLATLWELFPGHENLLPATIGHPAGISAAVAKPMFGW
jgi:glutathionylspermidine synthase